MSTVPACTRVLLVEDQGIVRAGVRMLLESHDWITVVGEAATATEALVVAKREQPNLILLDLDLGGISAVDTISPLREAAPEARIILLTGGADTSLHYAAVCQGAMGLVLKDEAAEVLIAAITKVQSGEAWLERTMVAQILSNITHAQKAVKADPELAKIATLTPREREVIALVCEGCKNKHIGERLHISETTVRHHLTSIFAKLELSDRLEMAIYAYRYGLAVLPQ